MRVHVTNGPRNGLNIGRKFGPCSGDRRQWVLGSVHAFSQAVHATDSYRPRLQVRARPSYPRKTPADTRTARAQPPAAHRRRHSRPHHHRDGEHSSIARQPHSNGLCSILKGGPRPEVSALARERWSVHKKEPMRV